MNPLAGNDISTIRKQFRILEQSVNGKPLVYFDNAATTQKPDAVIDALVQYYRHDNANIHRAAHTLAARATEAYEVSRKTVQAFIHAREAEECIFTRGVTESINLVANAWGRKFLKPGDEVLISTLEHHSNIVPWQMICEATGAQLRVIPVNEAGELELAALDNLIGPATRMIALTLASNAFGTVNPVKQIVQRARKFDTLVCIDAAQAAAHIPIDVQDLDCDFLAISSHKVYGPTGVGVLYGKRALLEQMSPYQGGGEMIREVTFEGTTYNDIPYKFEAGTPNIADVIAFKAALDFVQHLGKPSIAIHESSLLQLLTAGLKSIPGVVLHGTAREKVAVQSFSIQGKHPFDIGMLLDAKGIAVRTGHHCAQPLMQRFGLEGTVRASLAVYNTVEEVNTLIEAVKKIAGA